MSDLSKHTISKHTTGRTASSEPMNKGTTTLFPLASSLGGISSASGSTKKWQKPRDWQSPSKLSIESLTRARLARAQAAAAREASAMNTGDVTPRDGNSAWDEEWNNFEDSDDEDISKLSPSTRRVAQEEERSAFFELAKLLEDSKAGHADRPEGDMRTVYIDKCQELNINPVPCVVSKRDGDSFNMNHYGVGPNASLALADSIQKGDGGLAKLNLQENGIDERGCEAIANSVEKNTQLNHLDLSVNRVGMRGARALEKLITTKHLRVLSLSNCQLTQRGVAMLLTAVENNETLTSLNISNNNIDSRTIPGLVSMIDGNRALTDLDLSWNSLHSPHVLTLISTIAGSRYLRRLNLAWCRFGGPIVGDAWGKMFEENEILEYLNLAHNDITEKNAILILDGVSGPNCKINHLILSGNPIGKFGCAAAFLQWNKISSGKLTIEMEGCNFQIHDETLYDFTQVERQHKFDLSVPTTHAACRLLYKRMCLQNENNWTNVIHIIGSRSTNIDQEVHFDGQWEVPHTGFLDVCILDTPTLPDETSAEIFSVAISAIHSAHVLDEGDRYLIARHILPQLRLSTSQLAHIISLFTNSNFRVGLACLSIPLLTNRMDFSKILNKFQGRELAEIKENLGELFEIDLTHSTGRYILNLQSASSLSVFKLLSATEKKIRKFLRENLSSLSLPFDLSAQGDFRCFRNEILTVQGPTDVSTSPLSLSPSWRPPPNAISLSFDFVNVLRECGGLVRVSLSPQMHKDDLDEFIDEMELMKEHEYERVNLARPTVCLYRFSSEQCASLLKGLSLPAAKIHLAVMLWDRVIDLERYLLCLREVLTKFEILEVMARVGGINIFNPLEMDGPYRFDCEKVGDRKVAIMLADIAEEEHHNCITQPTINGVGVKILSSKQIPKTGVFECVYDSTQGRKSMKLRNKFLRETLIGIEMWQRNGRRETEEESVPPPPRPPLPSSPTAPTPTPLSLAPSPSPSLDLLSPSLVPATEFPTDTDDISTKNYPVGETSREIPTEISSQTPTNLEPQENL